MHVLCYMRRPVQILLLLDRLCQGILHFLTLPHSFLPICECFHLDGTKFYNTFRLFSPIYLGHALCRIRVLYQRTSTYRMCTEFPPSCFLLYISSMFLLLLSGLHMMLLASHLVGC